MHIAICMSCILCLQPSICIGYSAKRAREVNLMRARTPLENNLVASLKGSARWLCCFSWRICTHTACTDAGYIVHCAKAYSVCVSLSALTNPAGLPQQFTVNASWINRKLWIATLSPSTCPFNAFIYVGAFCARFSTCHMKQFFFFFREYNKNVFYFYFYTINYDVTLNVISARNQFDVYTRELLFSAANNSCILII